MNEGNKIVMVDHEVLPDLVRLCRSSDSTVARYACATLANLAENFECHDNIVEVEGLKLFSKIAHGIVGLMILVYLAFFLALAIGYGCNYCINRYEISKANKDRLKKRILNEDDDYDGVSLPN